MIIDIHTHTFPTSDDSLLTPEELITEAKRIGLDGICLTDHDRFWEPEQIDELSRKHNYLVLPGCEVTTEDGHLLIYGLKFTPSPKSSPSPKNRSEGTDSDLIHYKVSESPKIFLFKESDKGEDISPFP